MCADPNSMFYCGDTCQTIARGWVRGVAVQPTLTRPCDVPCSCSCSCSCLLLLRLLKSNVHVHAHVHAYGSCVWILEWECICSLMLLLCQLVLTVGAVVCCNGLPALPASHGCALLAVTGACVEVISNGRATQHISHACLACTSVHDAL